MGHATSGHQPMYLVLLVSGKQSEKKAKNDWIKRPNTYQITLEKYQTSPM